MKTNLDETALPCSKTTWYSSLWRHEIKTRVELVFNREIPKEDRFFAACELVCIPATIITLLLVLTRILLKLAFWGFAACHLSVPQLDCFFLIADSTVTQVLLSAAIGYLTNWIAIEMLFKPYSKNPKHFLSIITFGLWQQGLIPKNKDKIGEELGNQAKLLVSKTEIINQIRHCSEHFAGSENNEVDTTLKNFLLENEDELREIIAPFLRDAIVGTFNFPFIGNLIAIFFNDRFPAAFHSALQSDDVSRNFTRRFPALLVEIVNRFDEEQLKNLLGLENMVKSAVKRQEVKEFHNMISKVMAKHLGAIQILGYILGLLIGILQVL